MTEMDPLGKKELINCYDRHLRHFGDTPHALRWTPEGQIRRYRTFLSMTGDLSGKAVLDFGCGKGDFFGFLSDSRIAAAYCGIDVNENLISLAREKYPDAQFMALDIDEEDIDLRFDVIVAIGVFNLRIAGIEETAKSLTKKLFPMCRESLHVNFLTYYVAQRNVELFYMKPEDIVPFVITQISPRMTLRHDEEDMYLSVYHR